MKKLISILFGIICFISLLVLTIILNIDILTKYKNIDNITKKINYFDLVNLNVSESNNKRIYDNIYYSFKKDNISVEKINKFYNSKYIQEVFKNIIYNEVYYMLYNKDYKKYDVNTLNNLTDKEIKDTKLNKETKLINYNFVNMQNEIKYRIDSIEYNKLSFLRYIMNNKFRVILLTLIIICIVIEIILNKENFLPYILVGSIICSIIDIIISLISKYLLFNYYNDKFIITFLNQFIDSFNMTLMITGIIILFISVVYLMVNQKVDNYTKIVLKPRIKVK